MKAAVVPITAADASRASEAYQRSLVVHETLSENESDCDYP